MPEDPELLVPSDARKTVQKRKVKVNARKDLIVVVIEY